VLLTTLGFTFTGFDLASLLFLVAAAGGLAMGWFGWQAFQAEGGKFQVGGPKA
jgi:threonine/homoserine/homoserine lactone efflux protein